MEGSGLWAFTMQVQPVPLLAAFALAESPFWLRRISGSLYVPVYVPFLLDSLNSDLAVYYGEGHYHPYPGLEIDEDAVKRRLKWLAGLSMLLSTVVTPLWAGITAALILDWASFLQFLVLLIVFRAWRCWLSYSTFEQHASALPHVTQLLAIIYFFYVAVFGALCLRGYEWAAPYAAAKDYLGMIKDIADVVFVEQVGLAFVVVAMATIFGNQVADPKLRKDQLDAYVYRRKSLSVVQAPFDGEPRRDPQVEPVRTESSDDKRHPTG